jgi:hypothetical protein
VLLAQVGAQLCRHHLGARRRVGREVRLALLAARGADGSVELHDYRDWSKAVDADQAQEAPLSFLTNFMRMSDVLKVFEIF